MDFKYLNPAFIYLVAILLKLYFIIVISWHIIWLPSYEIVEKEYEIMLKLERVQSRENHRHRIQQ